MSTKLVSFNYDHHPFHLIFKANMLKNFTTHVSSFAKFGASYASQKYVDVFNQFILEALICSRKNTSARK